MEKVVVQETDEAILDILTFALKQEGFQVFSLIGFDHDFLEIIDKVRPHVVMLDYKLDGSRCIDICRQIKHKYPHLPVIALSCNTNIHEVYNQHGFDDYIRKPFDLDNLYSVLRTHIPKPL
jgi:DNA-binding response OmpR family regulator